MIADANNVVIFSHGIFSTISTSFVSILLSSNADSKLCPSSENKPGDSSPEYLSDVSDFSDAPLTLRFERNEFERLNNDVL